MISTREINRMKLSVNEVDIERSRVNQKKEQLHTSSVARYSKWGNTVDSLRDKKEQLRLEKLEEKERLNKILDQEEAVIQENLRKKAISRAEDLINNRSEKVKLFQTGMLEADVIKEREIHERLKYLMKEKERQREAYYQDVMSKSLKKMEDREISDEKTRKLKEKEVARDQMQQLKYYQDKRIQERLQELKEGEDIKRDAELKKEDDYQKLLRQKEHARIANAENVSKNLELKRLKEEEIRKAKEYEEQIEKFAKIKDLSVQMRKEKENERFSMKLAQRQKLIDTQSEGLKNMKNEEFKRLSNQIMEAEAKLEAKERDEKDKRDQLRDAIAESRKKAADRKDKEHNYKKTEEARFAERWKQTMIDLEEEEIQQHAETFRRELILANEQRLQIDQKHSLKNVDKISRDTIARETSERNKQDDEQFEQYARRMIAEYEAQGKDTKPLLLQFAKAQPPARPKKLK